MDGFGNSGSSGSNGSGAQWAKILGQSIFYSSIQAAIGSVEMSSKFSVINFAKDQAILDNACSALRSYLYIAFLWTAATMMVMYSQYGMKGFIAGLVSNLAYILWIYISYMHSFRIAADKYDLKIPSIFTSGY